MDGLPIAAGYLDRDLRLVHINAVALAERGWSAAAVLGQRIQDFNPPDELARIETFFMRALAGEQIDIDHLATHGSGSMRRLARRLVPHRDAQGQVVGVLFFGMPASAAARAAEAEQQQQHASIRSVLDALPLPLAYLDASRRVAMTNAAFCRAEGITPTDALEHRADVAATQTLVSLVERHFERAFSGQTLEYEHLGRDARWRRVRLIPHRADSNEVLGVFVISHDIHEQRLAQFALERREQQVREFSDNIPQPLAYIDSQDRVGFANRAFLAMVGTARLSTVGRQAAQILGDDNWTLIHEGYAAAKKGENLTQERQLRLHGSEARWMELRWWPEFEGVAHQGRVRGVYLLCLDVHDARIARAGYEASISQMQFAMDSAGIPMAYIDAELRLRFANQGMCHWTHRPSTELIGASFLDILRTCLGFDASTHARAALAGDEQVFETRFLLEGVEERWARIRFLPQENTSSATPTGFFMTVFDIDDLKTQQRELQLKQEELRRANWQLSSHLENSPLAAIELDADLNIRRWSERAERLFDWKRDHVMGRSIWDLHLIGPGEVDALTRSFAIVLSAHQQRVSALQRMTRRDGSRLWCEWYISALADDGGEISSLFALVQDVNQRVEAEARLQQLAAYDPLTHLPNRSSLQFELAQALDRARRSGGSVATIFIDLDHFKNVNDTLGHRIGDQLLLSVAQIMKSCVRKGDIVSRMGGDEFMIVIEHPKARMAAQHVADKILAALNQPIPVENHMLTIAASAGIAIFPEHGSDAATLLKNADVAMYRAKELGKGRFEFYSEELAREREEAALIEFSLRVAMASSQLALHYQPRVSVRDGTIEGAEALLRWTHPELGAISPAKFIKVAEETGLIFELGTWVFRRACMDLREWELRSLPVRTISINFSARQLLMRDLVDRISTTLNQVGCDPRKLEIEITETSMMFDIVTTRRVIASLKRLGLRIAIDDFGTGYSSLSHLQQLDIDALKIDQSFVRDLLVDTGDAAITRAVVSLGRGIGLKVIAEGVENQQQLDFLAECGCDMYQGFLFSPALPAPAFESLVAQQFAATHPTLARQR